MWGGRRLGDCLLSVGERAVGELVAPRDHRALRVIRPRFSPEEAGVQAQVPRRSVDRDAWDEPVVPEREPTNSSRRTTSRVTRSRRAEPADVAAQEADDVLPEGLERPKRLIILRS
jgi:hypothetical protein